MIITTHGNMEIVVDAISHAIDHLRDQLRKVASADATMLIQNEGNVEFDLVQQIDSATVATQALAEITEAAERVEVKSALAANHYHLERTRKTLGISIRTLHYKMSNYDLH